MSNIASLLNPAPSAENASPSPTVSGASLNQTVKTPSSRSSPPPKKQKVAKDAAIFFRERARGTVLYAPFEQYDEICQTELLKFRVHPLGEIASFHRHIPYTSGKKTFTEKTGREGFEVYQYTFIMPDDRTEKVHNVLWDYNTGLVRITPFFKSLGQPKTAPAKVISNNEGLSEITHSITGGSLAAQGYWMPYEAAKAVAATFCYTIRYVLVPLFGPDFPEKCVVPGDESFGKTSIDRRIVRSCAQKAMEYPRQSDADAVSRATTPREPATRPSTWAAVNTQTSLTSSQLNGESPVDTTGYDTDAEPKEQRRRKVPVLPHSSLPGSSPRPRQGDARTASNSNALTIAALEAHTRTATQPYPETEHDAISPTCTGRRGAVSEQGSVHGPLEVFGTQPTHPCPSTETPKPARRTADAQTQVDTRFPSNSSLPSIAPVQFAAVFPSPSALVDSRTSTAELRAAYTLCRLRLEDSSSPEAKRRVRKRRWSSSSWVYGTHCVDDKERNTRHYVAL